jgi:endonuclease YncB( thermonuclease family)
VGVVDGDTVKVITRGTPSEAWAQYSVRIAECDTPEMKGPTALERQAALAAKGFVEALVHQGALGTLMCAGGQDKFGRLLGDIVLHGQQDSIGQLVLRAGLGRAYNGGTKDPWSQQALQRMLLR